MRFSSSRCRSGLAPDWSGWSQIRFVGLVVLLEIAAMKNVTSEPSRRQAAAMMNPTRPHGQYPLEKGTRMHRLFRTPKPSRMDFVVNLSLGLAAVLAVVFSLGTTFNFCTHLDRIARRFSNQDGLVVVSGPDQPEGNSFTNAASLPAPILQPGPVMRTNPPSGLPPHGETRSPMSG